MDTTILLVLIAVAAAAILYFVFRTKSDTRTAVNSTYRPPGELDSPAPAGAWEPVPPSPSQPFRVTESDIPAVSAKVVGRGSKNNPSNTDSAATLSRARAEKRLLERDPQPVTAGFDPITSAALFHSSSVPPEQLRSESEAEKDYDRDGIPDASDPDPVRPAGEEPLGRAPEPAPYAEPDRSASHSHASSSDDSSSYGSSSDSGSSYSSSDSGSSSGGDSGGGGGGGE